MARITLTALLIAALGASDARSQFDTTLSVICEGCPFSEWLLEWDTAPGADELVQQGDSLYVRSNDGTGAFGPPQFVTALPMGEALVLFEDVDDDGDTDAAPTPEEEVQGATRDDDDDEDDEDDDDGRTACGGDDDEDERAGAEESPGTVEEEEEEEARAFCFSRKSWRNSFRQRSL